jgi:16S rRNA (guanine966-N2)-methyltransferase
MNLRIISGRLKGRRLHLKGAAASFRPTSDRVREAAAESVKQIIEGAVVADLCAGSGAFGFEMLSRGAHSVDFVESDRSLARGLKEHAAMLGVAQQCRIITGDVRRFVSSSDAAMYNIIFYDPPYSRHGLIECVPAIAEMLASGAVLLYEHAKDADTASVLESMSSVNIRSRIYGTTTVTCITRVS